jgi:hypothetical protein
VYVNAVARFRRKEVRGSAKCRFPKNIKSGAIATTTITIANKFSFSRWRKPVPSPSRQMPGETRAGNTRTGGTHGEGEGRVRLA